MFQVSSLPPCPLPPDISNTLTRRTPVGHSEIVIRLRSRDVGPVGVREHVLVLDGLAGVERDRQVPDGVVARVKGRRHGQAVAGVPAAQLRGRAHEDDGLAVKVAGDGVVYCKRESKILACCWYRCETKDCTQPT